MPYQMIKHDALADYGAKEKKKKEKKNLIGLSTL